MRFEPENPYTKRAISSLRIGEQESELEEIYLRRAQAMATVALAIELEQIRDLLTNMAEGIGKLGESTDSISDELSNVAEMVGKLQSSSN